MPWRCSWTYPGFGKSACGEREMKTLTGLGKIALLIVTMGSLLCSLPANTHAQDSDKHKSEKKTVLLISSYHPGFPTLFQQIDGIKSVFENTNIALDVEFMDSKRFYTEANLDICNIGIFQLEKDLQDFLSQVGKFLGGK